VAGEPQARDATPAAAQIDGASPITAAICSRLAEDNSRTLDDLKVMTDKDGTVWLSRRSYSQAIADRRCRSPAAPRV
jgi:hypothetical protein